MAAAKKKEKELLIYRHKPLYRCGNKLYYGDFNENFITVFTILATRKEKNLDLPTKVSIELMEKNGDELSCARLTKKAERTSLYAALDLGVFWLEDILEMEKEFKKQQVM